MNARWRTLVACALACCTTDRSSGAESPAPTAIPHAVVALRNEAKGSLCTGTVVAPRLVLTARHCVADLLGHGCEARFAAPVDPTAVRVLRGPSAFSAGGARASRILVPSGDGLCGDDLALVELAEPLRSSSLPVEATAPRQGDLYTTLGYGGVDVLGNGAGHRRERHGEVASSGNTHEWTGSARSCAGDSGAPAIDAKGRIIGVLGRGLSSSACGDPVYTSLSAHREWLAATGALSRLHATSLP